MSKSPPGSGRHLPSGGVDRSVALLELGLAVGIPYGHLFVVGVTWETYRKHGESGGKAFRRRWCPGLVLEGRFRGTLSAR